MVVWWNVVNADGLRLSFAPAQVQATSASWNQREGGLRHKANEQGLRALVARSVASALSALWSPSRRPGPAQVAITAPLPCASRHRGETIQFYKCFQVVYSKAIQNYCVLQVIPVFV